LQKGKIFKKRTTNIEGISKNKGKLPICNLFNGMFFNKKAVAGKIPGNVNIFPPVNMKKKKYLIK